MDIEEQYDKIYRYCYFKVKNQHLAEDITQETFTRFLEQKTRSEMMTTSKEHIAISFENVTYSTGYRDKGKSLAYLYTIAKHLCVDEFRKIQAEELKDDVEQGKFEDEIVEKEMLHQAMSILTEDEQELLLLRYVNEVSFADLSKMYQKSRFALYRELSKITKKLERRMSDEK